MRVHRHALATSLALLLAACGGGGGATGTTGTTGGDSESPPDGGGGDGTPVIAFAVAGTPGLTAGQPTLVASVRVGRTTFDYTYTVAATNAGTVPLQAVTGTVTSDAATTVVTDAALAFGDIAPGGTATSSDTFTIRQDRSAPLAAANLTITLDGTPPGTGPAEGVRLDGDPGEPALARFLDLLPTPARPDDVVNGMILTRLDVAVTSGATVGEVNAALAAVGGGIVGMRSDLAAMVVAVPRAADGAALALVAGQLGAQPGILFAMAGREAVTSVAPPAPANTDDLLAHLAAGRFPAAWNLRSMAGSCSDRVAVVVADKFHRPKDPLYAEFDTQVGAINEAGTGSVPLENADSSPNVAGYHGYDVLTTLAAALDGTVPTGATPYPECLSITALQAQGITGLGLASMIDAALPATGKVVVNTSLGWDECGDPCTAASLNVPPAWERGAHGGFMRSLMAGNSERVLYVTPSGNEADAVVGCLYPGANGAAYSWMTTVAARSDSLMSWVTDTSLWEPQPGGGCLVGFTPPSRTATFAERETLTAYLAQIGQDQASPATNVLIVGSLDRNESFSSFSEAGGDLHAVGEHIPTLFGIDTQGTSFTSPQVAALAAYLWMLSPELRARPVSDTREAIVLNTRDATTTLDAYAAVLSLDPAGTPNAATWLARRALLDVDANQVFDEADIAILVANLFVAPDFESQVAPASRDYGRHDLNGDGYTGGAQNFATFDLDRTGSRQYGAPVIAAFDFFAAGGQRRISESLVTDVDVLCYYAYSALYQEGDVAERDRLLDGKCVPVTVAVSPANTIVPTSGTASFAAIVRGTADQRVTWQVRSGGGSIDADGNFTADGTAGMVTIRATSEADPQAFGEATVQVGGVVGTITGSLGAGFARVSSRCGNTRTTESDPADGEPPKASGQVISRFTAPNTFGYPAAYVDRNASFASGSSFGGGAAATMSGSGGGQATLVSPPDSVGCSLNGFETFAGGVEAQVSFSFTVSGGPVNYSIGGGATETDGPAFGIIILRGAGADIYWKDSLGGSFGASSGTLQPGSYSVTGRASAEERASLVEQGSSDTESSTFNFSLTTGP